MAENKSCLSWFVKVSRMHGYATFRGVILILIGIPQMLGAPKLCSRSLVGGSNTLVHRFRFEGAPPFVGILLGMKSWIRTVMPYFVHCSWLFCYTLTPTELELGTAEKRC